MRATSLCLHDVLDIENRRTGDVYTLRLPDFAKHLQAIEQQKPCVRTIRGQSECGTKVPLYITFDDGTRGAYALGAQGLEQHGWRGHFFVTTDWVGQNGFMEREQILDLHNRGHVIGSHTCSHPERMSHLTHRALAREWKDSCAMLGDILGAPVQTASVAGGYYSRRVAEAAATAGIEILFTSEPRCDAALVNGCLVLGRYSIQSFTPPSVTGAIAAGKPWPRWKQRVFWDVKKILKTVGGQSYAAARRRMLSRLMSQ